MEVSHRPRNSKNKGNMTFEELRDRVRKRQKKIGPLLNEVKKQMNYWEKLVWRGL